MSNSSDILRLRVLICFLKSDINDCTVTGISRVLNEEKYTVSRAMSALEKDDYINRDDIRNPIITEKGYKAAVKYSERIEIIMNYLLCKDVDIESAKKDAFNIALYCTDKTIDVIRETEERNRLKYELREQKQFGGSTLCEKLRDGCYRIPFMICREHIENGSNLSMANEGFEHPCILFVKNGVGEIQLRSKQINVKSKIDGSIMSGKVNSIKYFDSGRYVSAEANGQVFSFPANSLNFLNVGFGAGQVLQGSVSLKMECSCGNANMPESTALLTLII